MNQKFVCNSCGEEINAISRTMHESVCNQINSSFFFCRTCQLYLNKQEEIDHLLGHQLEDYSNIGSSYFSIPSSLNEDNPFLLSSQPFLKRSNNVFSEDSHRTEPTEFLVKDTTKIPSDKKNCVICLVDYALNDQVKILPCIHTFHSKCIEKWFQKKSKCPLCKTKVRSQRLDLDSESGSNDDDYESIHHSSDDYQSSESE